MQSENSIENQVNQALDESIETLSPEVRRQLNQIRIAALTPKRSIAPIWKLSAATSLALMIGLSLHLGSPVVEESITPFSAELDEDLEMLDDLEFVYWLAEENDIASL